MSKINKYWDSPKIERESLGEISKSNIKVVDSIMGQGKTSWAIKFMQSNPKERFMYITPFLDEVERIKNECNNFIEPKAIKGSKLNHIRELTLQGKNIVSTHALMGRFDSDIQEAINIGEYTLILDEVAEVASQHTFNTKADKEDFFNYYAYVDEEGYVKWDEEKHPIEEYVKGSKFYEEMVLCLNNNLVMINDNLIMWELPVNIFKMFKEVYILTYMFQGSIQKPYFDLYKVEYSFLSVKHGELVSYEETTKEAKQELKELINIIDTEKLNRIGDNQYSLSSSWYKDNIRKSGSKTVKEDALKKNTYNFFKNICKGSADENMWTTFQPYANRLKGDRYGNLSKHFVPYNIRATNQYQHKKNLAYLVNVYPHLTLTTYFQNSKALSNIDNDAFALATLIQWIWRSRIRRQDLPKGQREINLYLPSSRMRNILKEYLNS